MKVKFKQSMVFGSGLAYAINQVAELDEISANDLIEVGLVEQVDEAIPAGIRIKGNEDAVGVVQVPKTNNGKKPVKAAKNTESVE